MKFIGVAIAALLGASPAAIATDEPPVKLASPTEIAVIGDGEMMDALQRAVEDEVAIINEDGGVMGWPLKVTREACEPGTDAKPFARVKRIASRKPILVLTGRCNVAEVEPAEDAAVAYAEENILVMQVPIDTPCITRTASALTLFCLSSTGSSVTGLAFAIAAESPRNVIVLAPDYPPAAASARALQTQLHRGFQATPEEEARWGKLLPPPDNEIRNVLFSNGGPPLPDEVGAMAAEMGRHPESSVICIGHAPWAAPILAAATLLGWNGKFYYFTLPDDATLPDSLPELSAKAEAFAVKRQPFYLGKPPESAKAYTAFHPDWVAGFWQVMKAVKYARSLDGREIAATLGGPPFFSRAPWLMLQSRSRYQPPELRQRFNDNGDLRMAGYKLEKIWPKD